MASTNKTMNYQLSQFQSSDIPAWLTDYNGDMQKIDAGIHAAKVQADGAASGVSILQTTVSGKQDRLNFDNTPVAGSTNPVTSGGIYNALQNAQIETDAVPTEGSTKAVQSGGVYTALQGKQNSLTFDSAPTQNSGNPVTSGGVFAALNGSAVSTSFTPSALSQFYAKCIKIGNSYILLVSGTNTDMPGSYSDVTIRINAIIDSAPTSETELSQQSVAFAGPNAVTATPVRWYKDTANNQTVIKFAMSSSGVFSFNSTIILV